MESARLVFIVLFCVSLFLLGEKWVQQYGPKEAPPTASQTDRSSADSVPTMAPANKASTEQSHATTPASVAGQVPGTTAAQVGAPAQAQMVQVETDLLHVDISTVGGDIDRVEMLKQKDAIDPKKNFVLLDKSATHTYLAQTGLLGDGLPTHKSLYVASSPRVTLPDGADKVSVVLQAVDAPPGTTVKKILTFHRGTYVIDVAYEVDGLEASTPPNAYFQLTRDDSTPEGDSKWVHTFTGVAVYTEGEKYKKVTFGDITKGKIPYPKTATDGWIGMVQHYFVAAWLPAGGAKREFFTRALGEHLFSAGVILPVEAAGQGTWKISVPLYVGPEEQDKLAALAPGLQYTVDYGWLTVIATPLFWALSTIHKWVFHNWGFAIIVLTILIKAMFFPLSATSYKSMAKMRVLAPKLQKLKEQYGDDRQKLHQAMMELYKTEKINPLGGCLPIVVQIPVFISLYWVLLGSVEMRHAPFILWITDLSRPDPFYVLPVLMGISMIVQSRLNPEPPDPIQAKVMKIMPIAFSVFFFFFPAGLVLYWLVNNVLSITQQWLITRQLERSGVGVRKR
ncbi:MAG: membrane protein insertase YidC [Betaproteobacteria bacterium]|nr:membrane protein insertase YidC [Betaproteobacteria bacterium]